MKLNRRPFYWADGNGGADVYYWRCGCQGIDIDKIPKEFKLKFEEMPVEFKSSTGEKYYFDEIDEAVSESAMYITTSRGFTFGNNLNFKSDSGQNLNVEAI